MICKLMLHKSLQFINSPFSLEEINFGDCLLKTKGAVLIGEALEHGHLHLKKVDLESNEIGANGGIIIASAMTNKSKLEILNLNGNQVKSYPQIICIRTILFICVFLVWRRRSKQHNRNSGRCSAPICFA